MENLIGGMEHHPAALFPQPRDYRKA